MLVFTSALIYSMKPGMLLIRYWPKEEEEESVTICFYHENVLLSEYHLYNKKIVTHSKTVTVHTYFYRMCIISDLIKWH
jgi:hypothetical protein